MDSISVSDSSEPDWDLVAPDSDDADWISSTICTKFQRPWSWLEEGMKLTMTLNGKVMHQHGKENK